METEGVGGVLGHRKRDFLRNRMHFHLRPKCPQDNPATSDLETLSPTERPLLTDSRKGAEP
jgi:murein endopeptidase